MARLVRITTSALSAALLLGVTSTAAHAAAPSRIADHITDVFPCGDPENPDFVLAYTADISELVWGPADRGNTDAAAHRGSGRVVETYSIGGHTLTSEMLDSSRDHAVRVVGDRLIITVYSSGVTTWSLDGQVVSRSAGTLRITYSENDNGTPNDRSDDFDYVYGAVVIPGAARNRPDSPDPCTVLAPFAG